MSQTPCRLGIDIGKVIIDGARNDGTDTSFFSDNFLRTTALPCAFESIGNLVSRFGSEHVFLVSKCGSHVQEKSLAWLAHHTFWEQTGMNPQAVRFCRARSEKAGICKSLGITHFIDDRVEILVSMQGIVTHRYAFNPTDQNFAGMRIACTVNRSCAVGRNLNRSSSKRFNPFSFARPRAFFVFMAWFDVFLRSWYLFAT